MDQKEEMTSIAACLENTSTRLSNFTDHPELEAQLLLAHVLNQPRSWLPAHQEEAMDPALTISFDNLVRLLESGYPLPYLVGKWDFYNLSFIVSPAVLIPRPETELLVEKAISWLRRKRKHGLSIVDVGTGCGCIAIALAVNIPGIHVIATDISEEALNIARQNAVEFSVGENITFINCDLFPRQDPAYRTGDHGDAKNEESVVYFDLIAANLPYIPSKELQLLPVSRHEPCLALDGGEDGLTLIRRLLNLAATSLSPGGAMFLEIEASAGKEVLSLAKINFPDSEILLHQDLTGKDRLIEIQRR